MLRPRGEKKKHSRERLLRGRREGKEGTMGRGEEEEEEERQREISLRCLSVDSPKSQRRVDDSVPRCVLRKQMEYREENDTNAASVADERYSNGINFCRIGPSVSGRNLDAQPSLRWKQREQTVLADSYNVLQPLIWISYGYLFTVFSTSPFSLRNCLRWCHRFPWKFQPDRGGNIRNE